MLSGDIGAEGYDSDNSFHVVRCVEVASKTVLDGFTISGGNAVGPEPDNHGGGMYTTADINLEVTHCTFSGNSADPVGGMYILSGSPKVTNCTFSRNSAEAFFSSNGGGGIYNDGGSPTVTNCTFSENVTAFGGAGIYSYGGSPTVANCTFVDNRALGGGGIYCSGSSDLTIKNTILADNGLKDTIFGCNNLSIEDGTINSSYNIVQNYSGFTPNDTDITGVQPSLNIGPLADNGGDTWTRALLPGKCRDQCGNRLRGPGDRPAGCGQGFITRYRVV